ncbi:protein AATF-like [Mytilus californianus]|uniref:protein AATF-like n=1 Tax=Mytilus californianus TaxID=6549 RepID=UPI0022481008|nr:protein AATF-like [Mytilus californianus]
MASLREQIAKLSSTVPEFKDPEDFFEDDTSARLVEKGDDEVDDLHFTSSKLRQRAAPLLTDSDKKYAGKRTSRKKLDELEELENYPYDEKDQNLDDESDELDEVVSEDGDKTDSEDEILCKGDNSDDEDEENLEEFQSSFKAATLSESKSEFSYEDDGDYSKYADNDEMEDNSDLNDKEDESDKEDVSGEDMSDDETGDEDEDEEQDEEEQDEDVKSFSRTSVAEEVQKGEAAKQQLGLWDSFLEGRIKLQKVAGIINQMPQFDVWKQFEKDGGAEFRESTADTHAMLKKLLDKLVQLQTLLMLQNSETRHMISGLKAKKEQPKDDDDDEEIPSDTDEEEKPKQKQEPVQVGVKRKIKIDNYPEFLAKRHKDFQTFRNNTIQKWYDKTRLSGGKLKSKSFSNFEQSALKQIDQILGDKDRLIKRTQLKRSVYTVLGKPDDEQKNEEQINNEPTTDMTGDHLRNHDAEIFDDSDFYHQQLRELIERKTADIEDPVAISRQWLEIQKLRNKVKKKIDTKASKGRKTRYNAHSKLVSFMAPMDNITWTDESKDDLYKSLFGRRFQSEKETVNGTNLSAQGTVDES